jgi:DNA repair protein RAD57
MADLPSVLPDLPPLVYARLLPSLEAAHVRTVDLLTLDGAEIARRARLPLSDVLRLCDAVARALQADLEGLRSAGDDFVRPRPVISTLDDTIDAALGGGVPTGYITEVTGERQVL